MAANCALYPHNWAVWGGFNKINKLTGRPPPAPEARGGQSLTKDQFVIAYMKFYEKLAVIYQYDTVGHMYCYWQQRKM